MVRIVSIAVGLSFFFMLSWSAPASGAEAIALISSLSGKVEVRPAREKRFIAARLGDQLFEDDVLSTRNGARANLLFSDGSIISVFPNSRLELSLKKSDTGKGGSLVASLSRGSWKGLKGMFSAARKRETLTAVAGIRKEEANEEGGLEVLYPRNSVILESKPTFRWKAGLKGRMFMVSLTLKGMKGKVWTFRTEETSVPYPKGEKGPDKGQTYFLRVEREGGTNRYDEV